MTARTMSLGKDLGMARTKTMYLPLTAELNELANQWAQRDDLIIRVLPKTGGAPARFIPAMATLDLNESLLVGADPKTVGSATFCQQHPTVAGALAHETAHAWQSAPWMLNPSFGPASDLAKTNRPTLGAIFLLEEGRIEVQAAHYVWDNATSSAVKIMIPSVVLKDFHSNPLESEEPKHKVIRLWGLMAARISSGLLLKPEGVQEMAERVLGAPALADGTAIANRFAAIRIYNDGDTVNMQELWRVAAEWVKWAEGQKDTTGGIGEPCDNGDEGQTDDEQGDESGGDSDSDSGDEQQSDSDDSGDSDSGDDDGDDGDSSDGDSDGGESGDESGDGGESGDTDDGQGGSESDGDSDGDGDGSEPTKGSDSDDDGGKSDQADEQSFDKGDDHAGDFDASKGPDGSLTSEQIEQILDQMTDKISESVSETIDRESKAIAHEVQEAERSANEFRTIRRKAESEAADKIRTLRRQRMNKHRRLNH